MAYCSKTIVQLDTENSTYSMGCKYDCDPKSFANHSPGRACVEGTDEDNFIEKCYTCGFGPSEEELNGTHPWYYCGVPSKFNSELRLFLYTPSPPPNRRNAMVRGALLLSEQTKQGSCRKASSSRMTLLILVSQPM